MTLWKFYAAEFEVDSVERKVVTESAWLGHRQFAYDLVRYVKPGLIVELGTHWGASFFSFCQALKDGHISDKCFAVDTWQGDEHAGFYGEEVFDSL